MLTRNPSSLSLSRAPFARSAAKVSQTRGLSFSRGGSRRVATMAAAEEVAGAYAEALASLGESSEKLDVLQSDMDRLYNVIKGTDNLTEFLGNDVIDEEKRREVLTTICDQAGFDQDTKNFLYLVLDKGRAGFLEEICESFEQKYCEMTDTQVALVTSAIELDEEEQYRIAKSLQRMSGSKNVKLKPVIDPSVIGGFVIKFGSRQIDLSLRGQVIQIANQLRNKFTL